MQFDKPEHQQLVLELIKQSQFPGHLVDLLAEFKRAAETADVRAIPAGESPC